MALQLLALDRTPPEPKSNGNGVPAARLKSQSGDGLLEDFLAQWKPDVLNHKLDHGKFFDHVVDLAKVVTGADGSAIAFRGDHGTICQARVGQGAPPLGAAVDTSSGISKDCLEWGMSIRCEDMETDGRVDPETCRALGIRSLAVVPIFCDRKISGILEVFSGAPANFTDQHLQRLQKLAKWVGAAASSLEDRGRVVAPPVGLAVPLPQAKTAPSGTGRAEIAAAGSSAPSGKANSLKPIDVKGWNHILLRDPPLPWHRLVASALLHLLIVGLFWGVTEFAPNEIELTSPSRHEARVTYYPFAESAPPRQARNNSKQKSKPQTKVRARQNPQPKSSVADKPAIAANGKPVNERSQSAKADAESGAKQSPGSSQAMPEIASSRSGQASVEQSAIPPAPDAVGRQGHRSQLPYLSAIAPVPNINGGWSNGGSSRRATGLDASSVVPPAPSDVKGERRLSHSANVSIIPPAPAFGQTSMQNNAAAKSFKGDGLVIAPAPSLEARSKLSDRGRLGSPGSSSAQLVPPPASIEGIGGSGGRGRGTSLATRDSDVVAPSPLLQEGGRVGGQTRAGGFANGGSQIVAPAPSLQSSGENSGSGRFGARSGELGAGASVIAPSPAIGGGASGSGRRQFNGTAIAGSGVVPPSPSLGSGGRIGSGTGGGRQMGSLGLGGVSIVPAPPSVQGIGAGNSGRGGRSRTGGLGGNGTADVVPPQPSMASGEGGGGRSSQAGLGGDALPPAAGKSDGSSASGGGQNRSTVASSSEPGTGAPQASAPQTGDKVMPVFQDAQVKVISLAWAPPKSSYFSNFEVFIAEKWLSKNQTEVIKLVYVFLPYQRRLSEYGADNPKVRRLRVTRDPSCDESLMQISWPEGGDPNSHSKESMTPEDRKNLLPCYRTTADDYRQAVSRNP